MCAFLHGGKRRDRSALIGRTIETTIIPRLLLFGAAATAVGDPPRVLPVDEVATTTRQILDNDVDAALERLQALAEEGYSFDQLCLELLAPCARLMGEMWEADLCDFVAVTLGLMRLHRLLRELTPNPEQRLQRRDDRHRVLMATAPGEQHSFGADMVSEFFRQDGWTVSSACGAPPREVASLARQEWFAIAGFSLSEVARLEELAAAIMRVRRASLNMNVGIMVGGPAFIGRPDLVTLVGADAMATDGRQAVEQAHRLVALLASPE